MTAPRVGKIAALALLALALSCGAAHAAAGGLDPSFDGDGKRVLPFDGVPFDTLVQPDGKIVLAGYDADRRFTVWRVNADGSPDRGFDGDGRVTVSFGSEGEARALALQADGKIVVAGSTYEIKSGTDTAVARLLRTGALDKSFDEDGKAVFLTDEEAYASEVLVQADGRIVLAGAGTRQSTFTLRRLYPTGAPDGTVFEKPSESRWEHAWGAALQPDGKIVVTGEALSILKDDPWDPVVARYTSDGKLDKSFALTGVKKLKGVHPVKVLVRPGGQIVVASNAGDEDTRMLATQLTSEGAVDYDFGDDGTAAADFDGRSLTWDTVLQRDGKVVIVGAATADKVFAVARFATSGALDAGFGIAGKTTVAFGPVNQATAAALQPDGKLIVAGVTLAGDVARPALARLLPTAPVPRAGDPKPAPAVRRCAGRVATIVGTAGRDTLRGTRRADVIVALGGNDRVLARGGNDVVCGGPGNDRLSGGSGRDRLRGGAGRDRCIGAAGKDRARGCERRRSL
jgi:uncharacterized delta-60 repeat protein